MKQAIDKLNEINNFNLWEQLSAYVSEYPVLFDKINKEYHRKDVKRNAWTDIGEKLGFKLPTFLIIHLFQWNYCFRKQPIVDVLRWIQDCYSIKDGAFYENI